ncbi:hypothetical protein NKH14_06845 [Mesorhizobium sp. M1380]|uniref:hypothetical protein n=1 Tax=Mesorhizobium sp. M1380 TaxID=2957093 RepID=UPI0033395658
MRQYDAPRERTRVHSKIAPVIMDFARNNVGQAFHVDQLRLFVLQHADVAPDSPGRILRELRREGKLDYAVINRRQSLYQFAAELAA